MYRDDHDAALRRAAELERKLAESETRAAEADELRAEVERLRTEANEPAKGEARTAKKRVGQEQREREAERKRELKEKRKKSESSEPAKDPPWYKNVGGWAFGGLFAALMGGMFVWSGVIAPASCNGTYESTHVVTSGGEQVLLVLSTVSTLEDSSSTRAALVRPSDGKRLAMATDDDGLRVVAPRGYRVWMDTYDDDLGLHLRDLETLEIVATSPELRARSPELAPGFKTDGGCARGPETEDAMLPVMTTDGRRWEIDARDLSVRPAGEGRHSKGCPSDSATTGGIDHPTRLKLDGYPRKKLVIGPDAPVEGESFLDGGFVVNGVTGEAIVLDDPPSALVAHKTSTENDAEYLITRISLDGKPGWTLRLGKTTDWAPKHAFLFDDILVVMTYEVALGVDVKTGIVSWRAYH